MPTADEVQVIFEASVGDYKAKVNDAAATFERSMTRVGQSSARNRAAMQQLSFQMNDVAQQFALGVNPMTIWVQQSGQVIQALQLMGGEAKGLIGFLGGPWGIALAAAATVAAPFVSTLLDADEGSQKAEKATRSLSEVLNDATASYDEVTAAIRDYNRQQAQSREVTLSALAAQAEGIRKNYEEAASKRELAKAEYQRLSAFSNDPAFAEGNLAYAGQLSNLDSQIARLNKDIAANQKAARSITVQISEKIAEVRSDPAARIREGFAELRQQAKDTIPDVKRLADRLTELSTAEDDALSKLDKGGRGGRSSRSSSKRSVAAKPDPAVARQKEYDALVQQLQLERQLQDLRARGTEEASMRADILEAQTRLESSHKDLTKEQLEFAKGIAAATIEAAYGEKARQKAVDEWFDEVEKRQKEQEQQRERAAEELKRREEQRIRTLASIYQDAFTHGTDAIWKDFKHIGLAVIAEVLARFTIAKATGGGFDLGSALTTAIGSVLPGFAGGGSMLIGGRGGVDSNVLSLNGQPIARVSSGETLNIRNPSLMRGSGGGSAVVQHFHVDARGAWLADDFGRMLLQQAGKQAAAMDAAAAQSMLKSMPIRMARFNRDGV